MRIIQITDLHISPNDEFVNGVNSRKNFINVLEKIKSIKFDFLAITGDLCLSDGDESVYIWIKDQLKKHKISNYHVIGGNHDNADVLAKVFDQNITEDELYFIVEPNIIFLDTIKGYCSDNQLKWFENKVAQISESNPVIFMHHPPFKSGVPHMDNNYSFQQPEEFTRICNLNKQTAFVFCGHYHNEISVFKENINMYITPSTFVQMDMFEEGFKADHSIPAFRIIDIDNSQLKTTVRYVFD